ncbi:MAG TPA: PEP-CTERM sorting domain-containing protein [Acidobacteriaceae bacterium]|nr:PEP-CTERM sorting domain-containing protein [Acidobacteriaceae bacterium]
MSVAALLLCPAAFADTFNFTYSGMGTIGSTPTNFTGSGTFTATSTGTTGEYLINSVSGTANGVAIAGLLAPGIYPSASSGNPPNDNFIFFPLASGGALDLNGFSFDTADGTDYNIYYFDPGYGLVTDPNFDGTDSLTFTLTDDTTGTTVVGAPGGSTAAATPEPGSLALLATGVFGIAGVVRRRFTF